MNNMLKVKNAMLLILRFTYLNMVTFIYHRYIVTYRHILHPFEICSGVKKLLLIGCKDYLLLTHM